MGLRSMLQATCNLDSPPAQQAAFMGPQLSYSPEDAARASGRSRTRIFMAIRDKELQARKDGRGTFIDHDELLRWIRSFRTIGRQSEPNAASSQVTER